MVNAGGCWRWDDLVEGVGDRCAECPGYWWRERVTDLAVSGCLPAGDLPGIGEALQPRHHADGQLGKLVDWKSRPGDVVGDAKSIDPEFLPFGTCSCRA
jgi:hypothetical protein